MTSTSDTRIRNKFDARDRRVIFLMTLVAFVTHYGSGQISNTLPFARQAMDMTEGDMSWVLSITRAASLLGLTFAVVADRRGRRTPFLIAFTLLPIANLSTALFSGPVAFTTSQSVARIALIAVSALSVVILAEELNPAIRALGIGIWAVGGSLGNGLGLLMMPIAARSENSYRLLFGLTMIGLLALPLLFNFLRESRAYVQYEKPVTFRRALAAGLGKHFWPMAGMAFFIAAFSAPASNFAMERLINDLSWDAGPARFLLIVFSGLGATGLIIGGRIADVSGRKPISITAMALGIIGGIAFYTQTNGWLLAPAILVASLGAAMLSPAFAAHRSELFPTRVRATAAGWVTNVAILGSITGFSIGGLMIDSYGLPTTITTLSSGLIIAMVMLIKLPETRGMSLVRGKADPVAATTPGESLGQ